MNPIKNTLLSNKIKLDEGIVSDSLRDFSGKEDNWYIEV